MIHIHILLIWHLVLHHYTLKLIHIICIIHINLWGHWHLHTIHYSYSSHHFIDWLWNRSCCIPQFMVSMSIRALISIYALSMQIEMSAFYCFVILWNCILIFYNNLIFVLISVLVTNQVILILVKISIRLNFVPFHSTSLIIVFSSSIHIILSSSSSVILFESTPYSSNILILSSPIIRFGHLIAILILNSFLGKIYLFSLKWIIGLS